MHLVNSIVIWPLDLTAGPPTTAWIPGLCAPPAQPAQAMKEYYWRTLALHTCSVYLTTAQGPFGPLTFITKLTLWQTGNQTFLKDFQNDVLDYIFFQSCILRPQVQLKACKNTISVSYVFDKSLRVHNLSEIYFTEERQDSRQLGENPSHIFPTSF